ncbi:MFS transporter [Streptomonospora salina]|uniref:Putative MFS family arabinose efflux permease n=1 Tax=Streptomonospora salina TaxID=104205 RepID=A0A841EAW6_9ACTN|nr:MFS transporter [Streptomonospora salina]MBB5999594.1 putative MFS family arabinose efflux permease [Streptomonospora salina]
MLKQTSDPPASGSLPSTDRAPRLTAQILVVSAAALVVTGQLYLALPLLSPIADSTGATVDQASWSVTAFGAAYALGFLAVGPLGPRVGYRRLIVGGVAATALFAWVTAFMPTVEAVIAARALQGCAAAAFAPTAIAYLAHNIPPHRRPLAFTALTSSFLAAAVVAQVAAQLITARWDWPAVFLASGAATAAVAVLARYLLVPDAPERAVSPGAAYRNLAASVARPRLLPFYGIALTLLFGFVGLYAAIRLADPLGVAADDGALLVLRASGLPAILLAPFVTPLLSRLSALHRLAAGLTAAAALIAAAGLSVPLVGSVGLFILLLAGYVLATAVALPAAMQASQAAAGELSAAVGAMYGFWLYIGSSMAAPVVAAASGLGFAVLSALFAGALLVGTALALLTAANQRRPPAAESR